MSEDRKDYYAVLGIPKDATPKEITAAWKQKTRELFSHPETSTQAKGLEQFNYGACLDNPAVPVLLAEIDKAHAVLSIPWSRSLYDMGETITFPSQRRYVIAVPENAAALVASAREKLKNRNESVTLTDKERNALILQLVQNEMVRQDAELPKIDSLHKARSERRSEKILPRRLRSVLGGLIIGLSLLPISQGGYKAVMEIGDPNAPEQDIRYLTEGLIFAALGALLAMSGTRSEEIPEQTRREIEQALEESEPRKGAKR